MRKVLVIALCFVSFGTLASMRPAFAVQKQVCNIGIGGNVPRQAAKCLKTSGKNYGCDSQWLAGGLAVKTCYCVEVQPGAVSDSAGTNPNSRYKPN